MCLIAKVHGNDKIQIKKNRRKKVKAIINNGCLHATVDPKNYRNVASFSTNKI
jgi:hypothetical protein